MTKKPMLPHFCQGSEYGCKAGMGKVMGICTVGGTWESHVVVELVGDTGLVYGVRPEKVGKEKTLHRHALKTCVELVSEAPEEDPVPGIEFSAPTPILYFPPGLRTPARPAGHEELSRRSARTNLGQPPARYSQ